MKSPINIFDKLFGIRIPVQFHASNNRKMKTGTIRQTMMINYRTMRCCMDNHLLYRI